MTKDQTVGLIRDAMMVLIERGVSVEEMAQVSGVELPAIEASATKFEDNEDAPPKKITKMLHLRRGSNLAPKAFSASLRLAS
jgi:hypothetical protein